MVTHQGQKGVLVISVVGLLAYIIPALTTALLEVNTFVKLSN